VTITMPVVGALEVSGDAKGFRTSAGGGGRAGHVLEVDSDPGPRGSFRHPEEGQLEP